MKTKNRKVLSYFSSENSEFGAIGTSKEAIKTSFLENLFYRLGRLPAVATNHDLYTALALTVRDRLFRQFVRSTAEFARQDARAVAYLSAEYLPGPHLGKNLLSLGITEATREALAELELRLDELMEEEVEPGLGNGGLGRLASCYLDGMATLGVPSIGYGIRYEFGIFKQEIKNGWQSETTDKWLHHGNPWEVERPEITYHVKFGGRTEHHYDQNNKLQVCWIPDSEVRGTAYDTPVLGYRSNGIIMRLWKAEAIESFDFSIYNLGDYYRAVEKKVGSENITKVLYPNDENLSGKELRLKQQFFFVTCSLQDMIRLHLLQGRELSNFHEKFSVQLNDTHPSIAVAELMRLLVDEHQMEWKQAWEVTQNTFAYTNHTLLPEALEKWSVSLLGKLLPRHLEIIYEINNRFLNELRKLQYNGAQMARMSLIDENGDPSIRMAHLATVGSYKVNGVSELHSELLKKQVLQDFAALWPEKFTNVTNGVSFRRFLAVANPGLSQLISQRIGNQWLSDLQAIKELIPYADDQSFQEEWRRVKHSNKLGLAKLIQEKTGVSINPEMLFDVHVKRLHEYKRQHLKVLHIIHLYQEIKSGRKEGIVPTAFIFAGKAAPGYFMAKLIIKLISSVADLINQDPEVNEILKVVFLPNFSVKQAQQVYPAADLSEQISLAGKEASGTGNMKFAMNGALTVGTLDGANVEIRQEVGEENFFLFGMDSSEVDELRKSGYQPYRIYEANPALKKAIDFLTSGVLADGDREVFRPLYNNLLQQDPYMVLRDFEDYINCQHEIHQKWKNEVQWTRMSILNVAHSGKFSSDRSVKDYCDNIWKVQAVRI